MKLRQTVINSDGEIFTDLASFVRYVAYYDRFDHGLRVVKERRKLDIARSYTLSSLQYRHDSGRWVEIARSTDGLRDLYRKAEDWAMEHCHGLGDNLVWETAGSLRWAIDPRNPYALMPSDDAYPNVLEQLNLVGGAK
jgi:hypothetical protein